MAQGLNGKINFSIGDYNVILSALDMVTLEPNVMRADVLKNGISRLGLSKTMTSARFLES